MKNIKKITAVTLSMLLSAALAVPAFATETSSEKEEVIYIMTDASGKVTDMEAVNIFSGGDIVDYGDYLDVKLLNTTDQITQSGNKITFSSDADKVYYQGTLKDTVIPWNISIRYFLDGKEYSAADIAGKSGALEIRFSVNKNESCKGSFYDDYALQASFTLDTGLCKNIVSDGATVANVGSDKQLTYTILPGEGLEKSIKANVTDFEMDAVTVNGVRLNLDIKIDDDELMDKVDEIINTIGDLDDGTSTLTDATGKLSDATSTLSDKVSDLSDGVGALAGGAGELSSGLSDITANSSQLTGAAYTAYEGLCTAAASVLNSQLEAYGMNSVTLTPSNYSAVLLGILEKIDAGAAYNEAYQAASQQVSELKGQLDNYGAFYQGLLGYTGAVDDAAAGAKNLQLNMDTLYSNTGTLKLSTMQLNDAVNELYGGTKDLADGTSEFAYKTSDMDTQISNEIDSMTSSITGSDAEVVSFVSDMNTNVDSVQFVIKTAAIEKAEAAVSDAANETPLTFWQKLLHLFGLY